MSKAVALSFANGRRGIVSRISMLRDIIARTENVRIRASEARSSRIAALAVSLVAFLAGFTYSFVLWRRGAHAEVAVQMATQVLILLGAAALWYLLVFRLRRREPSPARSFWSSTLVGLVVAVVARLLLSVGTGVTLAVPDAQEALGFRLGTNVPLALATVVKVNLTSVLLIFFAFVLLLRLRDLVLFKRTPSSQRNWYLMLGLMALASLATFGKPPGASFGPLAGIAMISAIGMMVVNSLRLSWIIFLSFRQKLALIALSSLLVVFLLFGSGVASYDGVPALAANAHAYLEHYSFALSTFVTLSITFGILYGVTSFLSLLFHLPTTTDVQQKVGELAAMHSLTSLVNQAFDAERLLQSIAASPVEAGSAHRSWLVVRDTSAAALAPRIAATVNITPEDVAAWFDFRALYEQVDEAQNLVLLEQAPADHRVRVRPGGGVGSLLAVPLIARDQMLGVLFATKQVSHGFEGDDVRAIGAFAAQAALALDHARLFAEQIEKERMTRELDIARGIQRKLLPQEPPRLRGVSISASSVAAQEVGGDYYDFLRLDEDRLAFIVADVAGKGTSAAFYMAEMQGIFQSASRLVQRPKDFLNLANRALAPTLEKHTFISVVYGILDTKKESLLMARAGHCPPAFINLHGDTRLLRTQGLGLGLDRTERFDALLVEEEIMLRPGDVFVLYTDGVVETRNDSGEEYGYDRLLAALQANRHEEASDLHRGLMSDVHRFSENGLLVDDTTVVVLKWHGMPVSADAKHEVPAKGARELSANSGLDSKSLIIR